MPPVGALMLPGQLETRDAEKGMYMGDLDSHAEADRLWKEMLDSLLSVLDTVERTIEQEQYSSDVKKLLVESMHLALEGLKDLKDLVAHLEADKKMPAVEELRIAVERSAVVMTAFKAWVDV